MIPDGLGGRTYLGRGPHPAGSKPGNNLVDRAEKIIKCLKLLWNFYPNRGPGIVSSAILPALGAGGLDHLPSWLQHNDRD
jgi:hypothetical protein